MKRPTPFYWRQFLPWRIVPARWAGAVAAGSAVLFLVQPPAQAQPDLSASPRNPGTLIPAPAELSPEDPGGRLEQEKPTPEAVELEFPLTPQPAAATDSTRFFVSRIEVEGAHLLSEGEIGKLVNPWQGQIVSLADLDRVAMGIQQEYHQRGYVSTQAFLPPQDIVDGQVRIQVVEGHVGQIAIEGNRYYRARVVARTLEQQPGDLFNLKTLQDDLNRSNRLNRFKLKATLRPGEMPGETDVRIQVAEPPPLQITGMFNNQGRPFIGVNRWGSELNLYSVTGNDDRLTLQWQEADGTRILLGSYAVPLNRRGTEIGASFATSHVDVDLGIEGQPSITGRAINYGLSVSQPLDRDRVWTADAGFNWRRVESFFDGDLTARSDIRSLQAGLNFNKYDRFGRTFSRVQLTYGPQWMGARDKFWKGEAFLTRLITLPKDNLLILRATGQYSRQPLPGAEGFQIGGAFNVRGYSEGLLLGDRGYTLGLEHRWPVPFLKRIAPKMASRTQGVFFLDVGQAWLDKDNPGFIPGRSDKPSQTLLAGAGVGLRTQLTNHLQGYVDLAWGLLDRQELEPLGQPRMRIHFGLRAHMFDENDYKMRGKETTVMQTAKSGPPGHPPPPGPLSGDVPGPSLVPVHHRP